MKKTIIIIITSLVLLASYSQAYSISTSQKNNSKKTEWTVMLYINADNNLESKALEVINLLETVGSNNNLNIVAQFDSLNLFKGIKRYYIEFDESPTIKSKTVKTLNEKSMGCPNVLSDFFIWTYKNYPAEKYYLSLFDHGNGWRSGFLRDETNNDDLSMIELKQSLNNITKNIDKKIDLLSFDACLMGMAEVYYQIRDFVDVCVGSEDVVYGHGIPYHMMLDELKKDETIKTPELAESIINAYSAYYSPMSMAMGAFKLNNFSKIIDDTLDALASYLLKNYSKNEGKIKNAIEHTTSFNIYYNGQKHVTHYKDLYDFAYEIKNRISDEKIKKSAENLIKAIEKNTLKEEHRKKNNSHGISIYLPTSTKDYDDTYQNLDICKNTKWNLFIKKCLPRNKIPTTLIELFMQKIRFYIKQTLHIL